MANSVAIIADPKDGKTYKKEVSPESLSSLVGRKIGDEVDEKNNISHRSKAIRNFIDYLKKENGTSL